ncbi:MAG: MBL fold metallo-hydrolase, partial [Burkholderiales bacterium]
MNLLEHELTYPLGDTLPAFGGRLEVAPGVYWLRMPLPFALDHINLWLLRDRIEGREGWTVIDCGVSTEDVRRHWDTLIKHEFEGLPLLRVLC